MQDPTPPKTPTEADVVRLLRGYTADRFFLKGDGLPYPACAFERAQAARGPLRADEPLGLVCTCPKCSPRATL